VPEFTTTAESELPKASALAIRMVPPTMEIPELIPELPLAPPRTNVPRPVLLIWEVALTILELIVEVNPVPTSILLVVESAPVKVMVPFEST